MSIVEIEYLQRLLKSAYHDVDTAYQFLEKIKKELIEGNIDKVIQDLKKEEVKSDGEVKEINNKKQRKPRNKKITVND